MEWFLDWMCITCMISLIVCFCQEVLGCLLEKSFSNKVMFCSTRMHSQFVLFSLIYRIWQDCRLAPQFLVGMAFLFGFIRKMMVRALIALCLEFISLTILWGLVCYSFNTHLVHWFVQIQELWTRLNIFSMYLGLTTWDCLLKNLIPCPRFGNLVVHGQLNTLWSIFLLTLIVNRIVLHWSTG